MSANTVHTRNARHVYANLGNNLTPEKCARQSEKEYSSNKRGHKRDKPRDGVMKCQCGFAHIFRQTFRFEMQRKKKSTSKLPFTQFTLPGYVVTTTYTHIILIPAADMPRKSIYIDEERTPKTP